MAIVYVVMSLAVMFGFCSLAVDLGRVQVAKTELRRAADAAARAGAANLSGGTQAVYTAASNMAAANKADGTSVQLINASDVQFLIWTSANNYVVAADASTPGVNAVRVYCRRIASRGNAVPLLLAEILGQKSCDVTASSIAMLNSQSSTQSISARSNPWLSGEATGTQGSQPDPGYFNSPRPSNHQWQYDLAGPVGGTAASGEPYESPVPLSITVTPGQILTISNVTGLANNDNRNSPSYTADGNNGGSSHIYSDDGANPNLSQGSQTTSGSEHGISNIEVPLNSMLGVFLDNGVPDTEGSAPPGLDFSTQTARDYTSIAPQLRQSFFVGNGQTSASVQQQIIVPAGATRMFLGTMDGHEWSNNVGSYTATVTQSAISIVQ